MRSERSRHVLALLRSQGLGLACGLAVVLLLGVGSFVMAATKDGASAGIEMDDLRPFFDRPSVVHLWFYLLVPVFGLFALNTLLATWHAVARKWRSGVRTPTAYGAAFLHVSFVLALVAHAIGGLGGEERGQVIVSDGWTPLPNGSEARLVALDVEVLPGGMPKEAWARLEVRDPGGEVAEARVGYNAPLSSGFGADLHLLAEFGQIPVADLLVAGARCSAVPDATCGEAPRRIRLVQIVPAGRLGRTPWARVAVETADGWSEGWVGGEDRPLADGRPARLVATRTSDAVLLRSRRAPGHPWALAAGLIGCVGLALLWRRFLPRRRVAAPAHDDASADPRSAAA